jgi:hypothetical protein
LLLLRTRAAAYCRCTSSRNRQTVAAVGDVPGAAAALPTARGITRELEIVAAGVRRSAVADEDRARAALREGIGAHSS